MKVDVYVLPRGSNVPIVVWTYSRNASMEWVIVDQETRTQHLPGTAWKKLAAQINRFSATRPYHGLDVFLRWFPQPNDFTDIRSWVALIKDAEDHSWGGHVYLAWKKSELSFDACCSREALVTWLAMIADSGLTAVIELSANSAPEVWSLLEEAAEANRNRQKELSGFITKAGWIGIFRGGETIERVVDRLRDRELVPRESKHEVIVYDRAPTRNDLQNLCARSRWERHRGELFRADITGKRLQLEPGLSTIHFNGAFEWLHAFIQLNRCRQVGRAEPLLVPRESAVEFVESSLEGRTPKKRRTRSRRLLITSGFTPESENDCAAAAAEVGACLRKLPFDVEVVVQPCISCEEFPRLLHSSGFTAWLHLSHGERQLGLAEGSSRRLASPERWINCFDGYRGRLELAMLSACESAEIAREIAKKGIGVAIGFENKLDVQAARIISEMVIPAAFERTQTMRHILNAFELAYRRLRSHSYVHDGVTTYYADCSPKAFAVSTQS